MIQTFFGLVTFEDCIEAMKKLADKSFDLCITDPPYNIQYRGSIGSTGMRGTGNFYEDNKDSTEYENFMRAWFIEARRVCNSVIFSPGRANLSLWARIEPWRDMLIHYKKNGAMGGCFSLFNRYEPYLCYGNPPRVKLVHNVLERYSTSGFLNDVECEHPTPKDVVIWKWILSIKPKSVLDPFFGSGVTGEACEELEIKYRGMEIKEDYNKDIMKRIQKGQYKRKNGRLF